MAAVSSDQRRALRLLAASDALVARIGLVRELQDQAEYDVVLQRVKATLPADEHERIRAEGERMKIEAAVEYALSGTPDGENAPAEGE